MLDDRVEELVGGRFSIEREAGAGAMARVYRARDVTTDTPVAVKVLNAVGDHAMRRFAREVNALVELAHPAIVRYIAHGRTKTGQAFLATEWLDGESLEDRLQDHPFSVEDTLSLARTIAGALAVAHRRGVVHRDVKPANIFLVDGDAAKPKLLDFGLARDSLATIGLTGTSDLLGTPLYMAPEQAKCELDIDARTDVYALGAVVFRCLAGRPPIVAPNLVGLLAKIVLEEAPRLATLVRGVPPAIDDLVARMLAKARNGRPADGEACVAGIAQAAAGMMDVPSPTAPVAVREQRVVSLVLATRLSREAASLGATLSSTGGMLELADGSTMVVCSGPESPGDLAMRAARFALELRASSGAVSLATGRAVLSGPSPSGEVIDRAAQLVTHATGVIRTDEETAALIEGRFELATDEHGTIIVGERAAELDPVRTLLGKPTRCVGRDRELAAIEGYFAECVDESAARAVIVVADAGVGKSRLAHELQRRLAQHADAPQVIVARCESITAGSPFAAAAAALKRAAHIDTHDAPAQRGTRLAELLARTRANEQDITEFLAEILAIPVDAPSERMRAARENPALMFDHIRTAWTTWLARTCADGPLLLVIEDLHWADESSIQLVDAALARLADQPFMVLALARPEIRERKPWHARRPHELRLDPLAKRASERLVRDALGSAATDAIVANIVGRAEGNALFLEELVRAAMNRTVSDLPVGVIGTLQLRFDALMPESRAVLRAASVFGERFTRDGVGALLAQTAAVEPGLDQLVAEELVARSGSSYTFRHALVREAAYALLTDDDRVAAHALAGGFLEAQGVDDPAVIARHFELGRRFANAARWYTMSAERTLAHNDLPSATAHARLAQRWTDDEAALGSLDLIIAEVELWRGNLADARAAALQAASRIPVASADWFAAIGLVITSSGQLGDNDTVSHWLERARDLAPAGDAVSAYVLCLSRASSQLSWSDRTDLSRRALERADAAAAGHELGPYAKARLEYARAFDYCVDGIVDACSRTLAEAADICERFGAQRDALQFRMLSHMTLTFGGDHERTAAMLADYVKRAEQLEAAFLVDWCRFEHGCALLVYGERARAREVLARLHAPLDQNPLFFLGYTLLSAWAAFADDDIDELERVITAVGERGHARGRLGIAGFRAYLTLRRGDAAAACELARAAIGALATTPGMVVDIHLTGITAALETLVHAAAPDAGDAVRAHIAFLERIAARFTDRELADRFLHRTPWNRRVYELRERAETTPPA